jgi:hypothetical protein
VSINEPLRVSVQVSNPLNCELVLADVTLRCGWKDKETGSDGYAVKPIPEVKISSKSTVTLSWKVTPQQYGHLEFRGVGYLLGTVIPSTQVAIDVRDKQKFPGCDIHAPAPSLAVHFVNLPDTIMNSQLVPIKLMIKNIGSRGLQKLWLAQAPESSLLFDHIEPERDIRLPNMCSSPGYHEISLGSNISQGQVYELNGLLRSEKSGRQVLRLLFCYLAEGSSDTRIYCTRSQIGVEVVPSLRVGSFLTHSSTSSAEHLMGIEVENLTGEQFDITGLHVVSQRWRIDYPGIPLTDVLAPQSTVFEYAKVCANKVSPTFEAERWTSQSIEYFIDEGKISTANKPGDVNLVVSTLPDGATAVPLLTYLTETHRQHKLTHLSNIYPNVPKDKLAKMLALYQTDEIDLALTWTAMNGTVRGEHYIVCQHLSAQQIAWVPSAKWKGRRTYVESSEREKQTLISSFLKNRHIREECPVRAIMKLGDGPIDGVLDVSIELDNSSWSKSFSYKLELLDPSELDS